MDIVQRRPLFDVNTRLRDVPKEWLQNIEPYVARDGWNSHWIWFGPFKNNQPAVRVAGKLVSLRRYIFQMFWETHHSPIFLFPDEDWDNCINPHHMHISINGTQESSRLITDVVAGRAIL